MMYECTIEVQYSELLISESERIICAAKTANFYRPCIASYINFLVVYFINSHVSNAAEKTQTNLHFIL
jgi:hypothetical protein